MIDARAAAKAAVEYLEQFYTPNDVQDLRVEEVELSDDGDTWLITLGFFERTTGLVFGAAQRVYKVFRVDREDGQVYSMWIRKL